MQVIEIQLFIKPPIADVFPPLWHLILIGLLLTQIGVAQNCLLSDEFESMTLNSSWNHFQSQYYTTTISNGKLCMTIDVNECNNSCPWYNSESAGFIYKTVVGDFDLVSLVESEEATGSNQGEDIQNDTQLAGIMARDGNSQSENYVFNVVGTRFDIPSIEIKSTVNGQSGGGIEFFGIDSTRSEVRMLRKGNSFQMFSRNIGSQTWILRSTFIRNDLPDTLQVGVVAYAFLSYPVDLSAKFEYVRFEDVIETNVWLGGNGLWNDSSMWSLNAVPDSYQIVRIESDQLQTIEILPNEYFECRGLEIYDELTNLEIRGSLVVKEENGCN